MASYTYINDTGTVVPDTSTTKAEVQAEFKTALGEDIDLTDSTPQGLMISDEVIARDSVARNNATLANQINPDLSGGVFLDALMALTGSKRSIATRSTVTATLSGVSGVTVPSGTNVATDPAGDIFVLQAAVTLPGNGSFVSQSYGAIPAAAGTLTKIVDAVLGWETITNASDAVLGSPTQSDQAARILRRNTLAAQGSSLAEAITSALFDPDQCPGVKSLFFRENVADITQTIDGVTMVPHSIYVCVDGGVDQDIADAIRKKKSGGCNWNGTTSVLSTDSYSGQSYSVKFDRPNEISIRIRVTASNATASEIKTAIVNFIAGSQDGESGFVVGQDVSPFEISGAINRAVPGCYVSSVELAKGEDAFASNIIAIAYNEKAVCPVGNISVILP